MDSAVGVPQELAEKDKEELTPMMAQYVDLCEEYDTELVLFHVGDFYKAFGEAADTVARVCELNLTTREDNSGEYKMAGMRIENAETHLDTLLDTGFRIAIAEQVEDPESVSGLADRAVTRVVTPGTVTEDELLDSAENNFILSMEKGALQRPSTSDENIGFAFLDVSTGEFFTTSLSSHAGLTNEIRRISPVEAIVGPNLRSEFDMDQLFEELSCTLTEFEEEVFEESSARRKMVEYFGQLQGSMATAGEIRAGGALLAYAEFTRGGQLDHLNHISKRTRYKPHEYMQLHDVALRGLEIFERRGKQSPGGATLIDVIDDSVTALGSRRLRQWLRRPLLSKERIEARHNAVEELVRDEFTRTSVRDHLKRVYDIERLCSKIARGRADARDIRSLHESLSTIPDITDSLSQCGADYLADMRDELPELADVRDLIDAAIEEDPAAELTEGGIIKPGYDDELDELRSTVDENTAWIDELQESERKRTGIENLRVGHTEVHGYYIEVTNSHLDAVPDNYTRRQTLKNSERYYTPELKEREDEIIAAQQRANELEYEIFTQIREEIGEEISRLQLIADHLARLDAIATFAELAAYNDYTRPDIENEGSGLRIEKGRHPVVEQTQQSFVANDTELGPDNFLAVITGPNMSGKSTYLRQVALITILAQSGSFVPADHAEIGITDQVFTRIGASDDITGGKSTFMVEMSELSDILASATENSLVLLDEVGRGTSTADGYALACAVCDYIHDTVRSTTLFATHHHELTQFISDYEGALNLHFSAEQRNDEVIFQYNISDGPATASYGIEVAEEAGLPNEVINMAADMLRETEIGDRTEPVVGVAGESVEGRELSGESKSREVPQELIAQARTYDGETIAQLIQEIDQMNIPDTTPIEALQTVDELQRALNDSRGSGRSEDSIL